MSRGSRGSRGGRGNRSGIRGSGWELDPDIKPDHKPAELFPPVEQEAPLPLTASELQQINYYRQFRDRVHEGPLYTILGPDTSSSRHRVSKPGHGQEGGSGGSMVNPFDGGMQTYTEKYKRKAGRAPRLDTRPYVLEFFPHELQSTLDPTSQTAHPTKTKKRLKIAPLSSSSHNGPPLPDDLPTVAQSIEPGGVNDTGTQEQQQQLLQLSTIKAADEELEVEMEGDEEEELDSDYESDEDDMGKDYNAEEYFDNGEEKEDLEEIGGGSAADRMRADEY